MTGIASSVIREKMVSHILSEQFPSVEYCNMYQSDGKVGFNQKNIFLEFPSITLLLFSFD